MKHRLLPTVICCLCVWFTSAQEFLPFQSDKPMNLAEQAFAFDQWAAENETESVKGWKWYARYLEHHMQRSSISGDWPDMTAYLASAQDVAIQKRGLSRNTGAFTPLGPKALPTVPGNRLFHGMGRINTVEFHPTDPNTLWVGVAQGGVWKTTDAGQSWMPLTDDLPIIRISDIAVDPSNTDVMYICVGDYAYVGSGLDTDNRKRNTHYGLGIYKSIDGGMSWNPTGLTFNQMERDESLMRKVIIRPGQSDTLVTAGISGVYMSFDGGDSWTKRLDRVMSDIEPHPLDPNVLFAASHRVNALGIGDAATWKSIDGGLTWIELPININSDQAQRIELAIAPSNPDVIYALVCNLQGGFFGLYRSEDGGLSWTMQSNTPNILHWYTGIGNGGQGLYDLAIMVDPDDPSLIYTGGINMWGSEDGGLTWKRASYWLPDYGNSLHADHHYYNYNPADGYFYACHDGGINRTQNIFLYTPDEIEASGFRFETQWEDISGGMEISSFYRMDVSRLREGHIIGGTQDNSTFVKNDTTWLNVVLGDGMDCFFHPTLSNVVYTSTQGGSFARSNDGGRTFQRGLTSQIPESGGWTTPFEQDPFNPNGIYAGFGNLYLSSDQGFSWTKLTDLPGLPGSGFIPPMSTVSPTSAVDGRIYMAQRPYPTQDVRSKMWTTPDNGATMIDITDGLPDTLFITASATSDVDPNRIWVTMGGFADGAKVFYSENAGEDWQNISFNLPNIPINAIESVPGSLINEVYIGTDVGIYYYNEFAEIWQLYSDGLPNVIVTDLVIDRDMEAIYASTFGRGIWKGDLAIYSSVDDVTYANYDFAVSPNPSNGIFNIELSGLEFNESIEMNVFDVQGIRIKQWMGPVSEIYQKTFSLQVNSGLYFVKIKGEFGSDVERLIVE